MPCGYKITVQALSKKRLHNITENFMSRVVAQNKCGFLSCVLILGFDSQYKLVS